MQGYQPTRDQLVKEIDRELKMRVRVWKGLDTPEGVKFMDMQKQRSYNQLLHARNLFAAMTHQEYAKLNARLASVTQAENAQKELF